MEDLVPGRILENSFEDPFFNIWSYLGVREIVAVSQTSKEIKEKSVFGFIANEIFAGLHLPLVFDNSSEYDLEQLLIQLKRNRTHSAPRHPKSSDISHEKAQVMADVAPENHEDGSYAEDCIFLLDKKLESASFDEYDDFTPRHPVPRDKVHRRGDSYFNSDITEAARLAADPTVSAAVRKFASLALQMEGADRGGTEIKSVVSPHVPTFGNADSESNKQSVFTFE